MSPSHCLCHIPSILYPPTFDVIPFHSVQVVHSHLYCGTELAHLTTNVVCLPRSIAMREHVWVIRRVFAAGGGHGWLGIRLGCNCGFWCMSWKTIRVCVMAAMEKLSSDAVIICIIAYRMDKQYFPYFVWSFMVMFSIIGCDRFACVKFLFLSKSQ